MEGVTIPGLELPDLPDAARVSVDAGDVTLGGYAWWQPGGAPAVLLMHGWGQDASSMATPARLLHARGWHAVSLSSRGWLGSGGCDDYGRSGPQDTARALDWLAGQTGVTHTVLLGFSMGGMLALLTTSTQDTRASAVVTVSPPTDFRRVYAATTLGALRRYYDAVFTPEQWHEGSPLTHAGTQRLPNLLVVGERDTFCPPVEGRSYAQAAGGELLSLPDMAHQPTDEEWAVIVGHVTRTFRAPPPRR